MNTMAFQTLRALADGAFHSGEDIARTLGVTRSAVWYGIRDLGGAGFEIEKVRGRGYRLEHAISLLDAARVQSALAADAARIELEIREVVDSTNTQLMQRVGEGAPSGLVLVAEEQNAGRGRRGRAWHSGIGSTLTFSVLWRFAQGARELAGLSLAVGLGLVRALRAAGAGEVQLKWPNDLETPDGKLAGILIEVQGDVLGPSAAVIGVGLNVRPDPRLRAAIDQPMAALETIAGAPVDRNLLLAGLLRELIMVLDSFAALGFAPLRGEWQRFHVHQDRKVQLMLPDGNRVTGVARGVADDGALLLESENGIVRYHSGDVSLRGAGVVA